MRGIVIPFQQRMYEMIGPSLSPKPPRGTMGQANTGGPVYLDTNGNPITSIQCGGSYTFDVPGSGLTQIWLTLFKNGTKTYDGLFPVPMPSYVTTCENDIGQYQAVAYDPTSGISLGQTTMTITAAGTTPGSTGGGILSTLSNLSTTAKFALAAGAYFLLVKGKRR